MPILWLTVALLVLGCGSASPVPDSEELGKADQVAAPPAIPSIDSPDTVDVGSWNVEWLGDPQHGPIDDELQLDRVTEVLAGLELDLMGLSEVVSADSFTDLVAGLPGYDGVLVTDPTVTDGADYYWEGEQKVALIYREEFEVVAARAILTGAAWEFGGRPPLEVKLHFRQRGRARSLVVVIVHMKARASLDGYTRRRAAAASLDAYLQAEYPDRWVLVIGDFNDDLDHSTYAGEPTPFDALIESPDYRFTTDALTADSISTTVRFENTIDHHLATDDLVPRFVEGSAEVLHLDEYIADFADSTSDHYPVVTRYDLR